MIQFQIFPHEFMGLYQYLRTQIDLIAQTPPLQRSLDDQVLLEYFERANLNKLLTTWRKRNVKVKSRIVLPLSVCRILHREMQAQKISFYAQSMLSHINIGLANLT